MNRRQRRKLARHATRDENLLPRSHGGIQTDIHENMIAAMNVLRAAFPGFIITLFLSEEAPADPGRLPRFNYASTGDRRDMIAVLDAFAARQRQDGEKLDRIADAPPTDTKQ